MLIGVLWKSFLRPCFFVGVLVSLVHWFVTAFLLRGLWDSSLRQGHEVGMWGFHVESTDFFLFLLFIEYKLLILFPRQLRQLVVRRALISFWQRGADQ